MSRHYGCANIYCVEGWLYDLAFHFRRGNRKVYEVVAGPLGHLDESGYRLLLPSENQIMNEPGSWLNEKQLARYRYLSNQPGRFVTQMRACPMCKGAA